MSYSTDNPWFYAVADERRGPVGFADLQALVSTGEITANTLVWSQGMADWTLASNIPELLPSVGLSVATEIPAPAQLPSVQRPPVTTPSRRLRTVKPASFGLWLGLSITAVFFYTLGIAGATMNEEVSAQSSVWIALGAVGLIASTVVGSIYIYRAWLAIQDDDIPSRTTPGKAVGFLFIPLFSLYWMFVALHGWSQDYNRLVSVYEYRDAPKMPEGLFLAFPILALVSIVPVVGVIASLAMIVVGPMVFFHICKAVNYFAAKAGRQGY
ncbi:protein of unknown function [Lampropedia hyalina DSM 16112]|jgi:hypothetical protein|uniref:GYF domain-containing protein n=1 Tax=Lampropedia hyalina DSM 16112 TaxID=1122156 RepID=A0A1M4X0M2_9BURK|nr:DUF4339 domain-containing protein [Lampropedia hyalina]SHE87005.1 protein of unknown function [Lampropedia hyalina DSM 16112]